MDALGSYLEVCAMATRKSKGRQAAPPPATEDGDEPASVWVDAVDEVDVALADLPADTVVKVYRIPENGEKEWCWTGDPTSVSEERIARFGPGEYLVLARGAMANGGEGFRRRRKVRIARGLTPEPVAAPNGTSLADQVASAAVLGLVRSMQDAQDRTTAQAREHSTAMALLFKQITEPRAVDPLMMEIVKSQLGAAHKTADPFDVAARIAEIGAKGHRGSALTELAGALDTLEKLKARLGGGGNGNSDGAGDGDGWAGFFTRLLPRVLPEAPALGAGEVAAPNVRQPEPAPEPVAALPPHLTALEAFLPDIINAAERGVDPSAAADWIIANIPDEALPIARQVLAIDTLTADLMAAEPRLRAHRAFLVDLTKSALEAIDVAMAPDAGEG